MAYKRGGKRNKLITLNDFQIGAGTVEEKRQKVKNFVSRLVEDEPSWAIMQQKIKDIRTERILEFEREIGVKQTSMDPRLQKVEELFNPKTTETLRFTGCTS